MIVFALHDQSLATAVETFALELRSQPTHASQRTLQESCTTTVKPEFAW